MGVPYDIEVPDIHDVRVDADGDIEILVEGGYHGDKLDRTFTIDDLRIISEWAKAQKDAYDAYAGADYDEQAYFDSIGKFKTWKGITA